MKKLDFSNLKASRTLAKKNSSYLDLQSVINRARQGFTFEQSRLRSKPVKQSASEFLRQVDLLVNMVGMPHILLMTMEGYADGWESAFRVVMGENPELIKRGNRKRFEAQARNTMLRFFALDSHQSGALSRPWLFAITVYVWTAFESLASDLWTNSLNNASALVQEALAGIPSDSDGLGISRRHIDVGLAARHGFDLRRCLGSVLAPKFDFTSFDGIVAAYEQAFGEFPKLRELADGLKAIERTRHLIVHHGGIVDQRFVQLSKLRVRPGTALKLTVEKVRDFVITMTLGSLALLKGVDAWFVSKSERADATP